MDPTGDDAHADNDASPATNSAKKKKNLDELGFNSTKDLVWAKAYPHTWWPGRIQKKTRGKVLVSLFESNRTISFREREVSSFEGDFAEMVSRKGSSRLQPAIESALGEFSRRLVAEMSCECQRKEGEVGGSGASGFRSVGVLEFVKGMAVSSSFEETESVRVSRAAAEVELFRRFAFVKQDSDYEEAMRVAELVGDADADAKAEGNKMSISFEDEIACSMIQEMQVKDKKEQEDDDELEKEVDIHMEYVEQVKSDAALCKNNIKESLEQHPIERSLVIAHQAFHPVEALAFVRRMAVSFGESCVDTDAFTKTVMLINAFRDYAFTKHDWIYQETMRLSESTNALEANINGTVFEKEQTCKVIEEEKVSECENNQKLAVKPVKHDLLISKTITENPLLDVVKGTVFEKEQTYKVIEEEKVSECENNQKLAVRPVKHDLSISKTITENPLLDVVKGLYCLALDPFSGEKGHGVKNFNGTRQKILRFRELVYLKALNRPLLLEHTPVYDRVAETSKVHKLLKINSTTCPGNISVHAPAKENIVVNKTPTQKFQHLSNVRSQRNKMAKVDARLGCSTSNDEDAVRSVDRDVELFKDSTSCSSEYESNRRQKTKEKVCSNISDVVEGVNISNLKRNIADCKDGSKSNKSKKTYNGNVNSTSDVESRNVNTPGSSSVNKRQKTDDAEVDCRIGNVECSEAVNQLKDTSESNSDSQSSKRQKISTIDPVVLRFQGGITKTPHVNKSACPNDDIHESKISPGVLSDHLHSKNCNEIGINGSAEDVEVDCDLHTVLNTCPGKTMPEENMGTQGEGDVTDLCNGKPNTGIVSGGSSKGNQRPSKTTVGISVKSLQTKTLQSMSGLHSSPLSAKSPASTEMQVQSSKSHTGPVFPATLHMKFPKDFKLPSKEELVKRFRAFGPIDNLKTKVFFYTGSAQVVFLSHLDAEAACQYAKRKKIFLGGVNIRFWLDQHEHSKRGATNISSPGSLPTTGSSTLDAKSCLKTSSPQKTKSEKETFSVKFPSASQDQPSYHTETTNEVLLQSGLVKCSKEVAPDISLQMLALLKKCNQIVTEVKDSLGPQSFYSVFSRDYCYTKSDDH